MFGAVLKEVGDKNARHMGSLEEGRAMATKTTTTEIIAFRDVTALHVPPTIQLLLFRVIWRGVGCNWSERLRQKLVCSLLTFAPPKQSLPHDPER
jgi:hypothetical protein